MNLTEVLNLLMVILTLLGLILEVIRLTVEVMDKNSQKDVYKRQVIGHLFQDPLKGTAPNMTIEENLALAYLRAGTAPHAIFSRISRKEDVYKRQGCGCPVPAPDACCE